MERLILPHKLARYLAASQLTNLAYDMNHQRKGEGVEDEVGRVVDMSVTATADEKNAMESSFAVGQLSNPKKDKGHSSKIRLNDMVNAKAKGEAR